jgi:hypothetical protein
MREPKKGPGSRSTQLLTHYYDTSRSSVTIWKLVSLHGVAAVVINLTVWVIMQSSIGYIYNNVVQFVFVWAVVQGTTALTNTLPLWYKMIYIFHHLQHLSISFPFDSYLLPKTLAPQSTSPPWRRSFSDEERSHHSHSLTVRVRPTPQDASTRSYITILTPMFWEEKSYKYCCNDVVSRISASSRCNLKSSLLFFFSSLLRPWRHPPLNPLVRYLSWICVNGKN